MTGENIKSRLLHKSTQRLCTYVQIFLNWKNTPGFSLLVEKLIWRHLNKHWSAKPLKNRAHTFLILYSQVVPVHTWQHAQQAPLVCLATDCSSTQRSPDWLTKTTQSQHVSPCSTAQFWIVKEVCFSPCLTEVVESSPSNTLAWNAETLCCGFSQ